MATTSTNPALIQPETTLAERYRTYLFDSMPGKMCPDYRDHTWDGSVLLYQTYSGSTLHITVTLTDTHQSVADKIRDALEIALEDQERERMEEMERIRREADDPTSPSYPEFPDGGFMFHLSY